MQTTLPTGEGIRWPEGRQIAVLLTFDFDADRLQSAYFRQEDLPFADRSRGLYGPDEGLPRILSMLSRQNVPATFFVPGQPPAEEEDVYIEHSFAEIADFCKWRYIQSLSDYVELSEGPEIWDFLLRIWQTMKRSIEEGLAASGPLPGGLNVQRKAKYLYEQTPEEDIPALREFQQIAAFAYAVAEQNAGHGTIVTIVTAPTCGACGVVPAVLRYAQVTRDFTDQHQRLHLRGGVRLSGGDRHRLLHGRRRLGRALRPEFRPSGVRGRGGHGTPPGPHLRPGLRSGADPLHRAQRRGGHAGHECLQPQLFSHRLPEHQLRYGL